MRSYVISTDSSADLSEAYLKEHQITMISLSCILNGETYNSENPITPKQLYDNIREGAMPTTSQVNPEQAKAAFEPLLKEGKDILHLAFSSGLSGSCQSARIAAEELKDEYPERKIVVIDTLLAASRALAELITDEELSEDYIIPKAFDPRVGKAVAAAVADAARKTGVARL